MTRKEYAEKHYRIFSEAEGNQHIASLFAIKKALDIIAWTRPENILEVGLGIGSFASTIMGYMNRQEMPFKYYGTENNEFCLGQLPLNLKEKFSQLRIFANIDSLPDRIKFDFVIIDGSDNSLLQVRNLISQHGIIFIEGDRMPQLEAMRSLFPDHRFVHAMSGFMEPEYSPFQGRWSGGGKLLFVNPTLRQRLHYILERIRTAINRRKRPDHSGL